MSRRYPWQRKRLRLLLVLMVPAGLLVAYAVYRAQVAQEVRDRIEALQSSPLPATLSALQAWQEPVPEEENAAPLFLDGLAQLKPASPEQTAKLPVYSDTFYEPQTPLAPEVRRGMFEILKTNAPSLHLLHRAASMARCNYPLQVEDASVSLPQRDKFIAGARLLAAQAVLAAEVGNVRQAGQSVSSLLALSQSLRSVPLMEAQVERFEIMDLFHSTLLRVLNRAQLEAPALQKLLEALLLVDFSDGLKRGLAGDRVRAMERLPELSRHAFLQFSGVLDRNTLAYLDIVEDALELVTHSPAEAAEEWEELNQEHHFRGTFLLQSEVYRAFFQWPRAACHLALAQAAAGVEVHAAVQGGPPETLQELEPDILPQVPLDPYTGKSIQYHRQDTGGYSVFSAGPEAPTDQRPMGRRFRHRVNAEDLALSVSRGAAEAPALDPELAPGPDPTASVTERQEAPAADVGPQESDSPPAAGEE